MTANYCKIKMQMNMGQPNLFLFSPEVPAMRHLFCRAFSCPWLTTAWGSRGHSLGC